MELLLGGLVGVVRAGEFLGLHRLVGEGLGRADAGKRGFDVGVDDRRLFLDAAGGRPHGLAAREAHKDEHRDHHGHDQRQPPFDRRHDGQRADDGHERDEQVLRPVVGKLGDLKQIRRHPAHELAGPVAVKKLEAQLLHMAEERRADIGLHADAERMAPVGDDKVEQRAQRVRRHHDQHHREKRTVGVLRQQRPHRVARDDRVSQIDQRLVLYRSARQNASCCAACIFLLEWQKSEGTRMIEILQETKTSVVCVKPVGIAAQGTDAQALPQLPQRRRA